MSRLITLILILFISACGQKSENKESKNINSVKQSTEVLKTKNVKAQFEKNKSTHTKNQQKLNVLEFYNGSSHEKLKLNGKTLVVIQLDSVEIEQLKKIDGEDNFYTAADDLMWYNSIMQKKMDSLTISVKYTDKDTVDLISKNYKYTIIKDSTFSLYTYFFYNEEEIKRRELFELIDY